MKVIRVKPYVMFCLDLEQRCYVHNGLFWILRQMLT